MLAEEFESRQEQFNHFMRVCPPVACRLGGSIPSSMSYEASIHRNYDHVGRAFVYAQLKDPDDEPVFLIQGNFWEGRYPAIMGLNMGKYSRPAPSGVKRELMRRFLYAAQQVGCSCVGTNSVGRGCTYFRELGFDFIDSSLDVPKALAEGASVTELIQENWRYYFIARFAEGSARAIANFTDEQGLRKMFRRLKLPLVAYEWR